MKHNTIDEYLNSISRFKREDYCDFLPEPKYDYKFYGDGEGDFEESGDDATMEVLEDYIKYLEEQRKWTLEAIDKKQNCY